MAERAPTSVKIVRLPVEPYAIVSVRVTASAADVATEWVAKEAMGVSEILCMLGVTTIGAAGDNKITVAINTRGSEDTEGDHDGDLGFEDAATTAQACELTFIGKLTSY